MNLVIPILRVRTVLSYHMLQELCKQLYISHLPLLLALKQALSLASHLQVIARGREISVIFTGEYHSKTMAVT